MPVPDWKSQIHPDLRRAFRMMPNMTFGPWRVRAFRALERYVLPFLPTPSVPEGVSFRQVEIGDQRIRLFTPTNNPQTPAALLWLHGGGRVMGQPELMDRHCVRLARDLGILAASASYRLAPEHRYPAALDDCRAAFGWLVASADALQIAPDRIAVAGESAGGGLAAELCQRICDEGGVQPAAQALVYPMLDDRTATRDDLTEQRFLVWDNRSNHYGWRSYLGVAPGSAAVGPYAAAGRRADLAGLPPAWITVGDLDLFLAEDLDYAERLRQGGVEVEIARVEGGFHGYFAVGRDEPPIQRVWASFERFLRTHLAIDAP